MKFDDLDKEIKNIIDILIAFCFYINNYLRKHYIIFLIKFELN